METFGYVMLGFFILLVSIMVFGDKSKNSRSSNFDASDIDIDF